MRVWSAGSGEPAPMDVGAVAQLTKVKKGDKVEEDDLLVVIE